MPIGNQFHHQKYSGEPPQAPYEQIAPMPLSTWDRERSSNAFQSLAEELKERRTKAVYLVHGTFAGTDALGIIRELERWMPSVGQRLRHHQKTLVDSIVGEIGNYSQAYADYFAQALQQTESTIKVKLFHWTGENLHLARANAAVRLLDQLLEETKAGQARFLIWGHSHAGNVFALLTNLIGSDVATLRRFFSAGRSWWQFSVLGHLDRPVWQRVRRQVLSDPDVLRRIELDIITFGTPIRYGWETRGYRSLLHVVHHRPKETTPEYLAPFPESLAEVLEARYGDYVQQLGVAGTNLTPYLPAWRSWIVEERFRRFLQSGIRRRDTLDRLRLGQRVAAEGKCLLVDYPDDDSGLTQQVFGHAIYTRAEWLPFHVQRLAIEMARQHEQT